MINIQISIDGENFKVGRAPNGWENTFNSIIDKTELKIEEKLILLAILRFYNPVKKYSSPSVKAIKEITGIIDNNKYYQYIHNLVEKGFLRKENSPWERSKYFINI